MGAGAVLRAGLTEPLPDRWPRIAMVTYGLGSDPARYALPAGYVAAVRRAGGRPVLVPPGPESAAGVLDLADGLLLAGGGDLDPGCYGGSGRAELYGVDPARDRLELDLVREAAARRMPTLAICRGMQVVNVQRGGDVVQHLPDAVGTRVAHRAGEGKAVMHPVRVARDSRLAELCGATRFDVASMHHQAPRRLGRGLRAVAWSDDGVVEAVEAPDRPELVAVQWHPEETAATDPIQQGLFGWLVDAARRNA